MPNPIETAIAIEQGKKYARAFTAALNAVKCREFELAEKLIAENPPSDRRVIANRIQEKKRENE